MRAIIRKQLVNVFERELLKLIPFIERVALPTPSGSVAWRIADRRGISAYVLLIVSTQQNDRFTVEISWSRKKGIPLNLGKIPGEEGDTDELRFRLSRLWKPNGFEIWYDLQFEADHPESGDAFISTPEQECLDRVEVKVGRAMKALKEFGFPYIETISPGLLPPSVVAAR